jgi:PAS domain S-box-containing protein
MASEVSGSEQVAAPPGGSEKPVSMMTKLQSNLVMTGGPRYSGAVGELSQANVRLEQENARLRARLVQAGLDVRHTAEATAAFALQNEKLRLEDAALREREHVLQRITNAMPGIVVVFDLEESRSVFVNRAVAAVLGFSAEEIVALGDNVVPALMHPDDLARFPAHLKRVRALRDDETAEFEHRMRAQAGEWRWFRSRDAAFARDDDGAVSQLICASMEITALKEAEARLIDSKERLQLALTTGNLGLWELDLASGNLDSSEGCRANFGIGPDDPLTYDRLFELIHPDDRVRVGAAVQHAFDTRTDYHAQYRVIWPNGETHWIIASGRAIAAAEGHSLRMAGVTLEITERKLAEAKLTESEALFRAVFEYSPTGIAISDTDGRLQLSNPAHATLIGYSEAELIRKKFSDLVHPDDLETNTVEVHRLLRGEIKRFEIENRYVRKDGETVWVNKQGTLLRDSVGNASRLLALVTEITERKLTEERLRASEEFARMVLEASPDCLKVIGADGRLDYVNHNGACLLEVDGPNAVMGHSWESLWPDELRPKIRQSIEAARAGQLIVFTAEGPTAKGTSKHWEVSLTAIPSQDDQTVKLLVASRDVTEKKRSEIALIKSEARFRAAVEAVDGIVWTNNADGEMSGEQPGWSALTGQTPAEYEGFGWAKMVHPEDAQPTLDAWNAAVGARVLFEFEHRLRRRDGEWRHFSVRAAPIFDKGNQIVEWVGVHTDISAKKDAEAHRELLMRELAHRSKNQLAVIQGVASQTARRAGSLDEFRKIFATRLEGMAISADVLIAHQWDGASLGDLVHRQLAPFGTDEGRLLWEGRDVFLTSEAAETIGLALHELATNCVKYGAWSVPGGVVKVSSTLDPGGEQKSQLRVGWSEHGGPAVEPPTREGFGRRVIERIVAQKLGGTVELVFDVQGVRWTLVAPSTQFAEVRPAGDGRSPRPAGTA